MLTEQAYILKHKREKTFLTGTAKDNLELLFKDRPELVQQIPVNKIAKYLGIHPGALSRLRRAKS
jgi:hypothetical protein